MIVGVLHNLVDSVLEIVNICFVVSDDVSVRLDGFLDDTLPQPKVLDHVP